MLGREFCVLWATTARPQTVEFPGRSSITVVQKDGSSRVVSGMRIEVTADPIYVAH